jgi:hypothetical protein
MTPMVLPWTSVPSMVLLASREDSSLRYCTLAVPKTSSLGPWMIKRTLCSGPKGRKRSKRSPSSMPSGRFRIHKGVAEHGGW